MDNTDRIVQWEKMTREAPDDMSWFSLGNAYKDEGRFDEAARALAESIKINPNLSRAYQLRGQVLIQLSREEEAAHELTRGYTIAAERGDVMPQRAIGSLLEQLGKPVPNLPSVVSPPDVRTSSDTVIDRRTGQPGQRLPDPPMRGPLGRLIYEQFSQETWQQWIRQGTKVINELRLDFSNPQHQQAYEQQMMEWLGISSEEVQAQETHPSNASVR